MAASIPSNIDPPPTDGLPSHIQFEAAPDVEVFLRVIKGGRPEEEDLEANINISKTVSEVKQSLSKPLHIQPEMMELKKDDIKLEDDKSLLEYDIASDDVITIIDHTPVLTDN